MPYWIAYNFWSVILNLVILFSTRSEDLYRSNLYVKDSVNPVWCSLCSSVCYLPEIRSSVSPYLVQASLHRRKSLRRTLYHLHNYRGFITADVRVNGLGFEAIANRVDSKGLIGTKDTDLPRFGPSSRGHSLRPACVCIACVSITRS